MVTIGLKGQVTGPADSPNEDSHVEVTFEGTYSNTVFGPQDFRIDREPHMLKLLSPRPYVKARQVARPVPSSPARATPLPTSTPSTLTPRPSSSLCYPLFDPGASWWLHRQFSGEKYSGILD